MWIRLFLVMKSNDVFSVFHGKSEDEVSVRPCRWSVRKRRLLIKRVCGPCTYIHIRTVYITIPDCSGISHSILLTRRFIELPAMRHAPFLCQTVKGGSLVRWVSGANHPSARISGAHPHRSRIRSTEWYHRLNPHSDGSAPAVVKISRFTAES